MSHPDQRPDQQRPDQRRIARQTLPRHPSGVIVLRIDHEWHPIHEVRDISDVGMSFYLERNINVAQEVAIEYSHQETRVEVYGRVAWCKKRGELLPDSSSVDGYVMGVELLNPAMLYALITR